MSKRFRDYAANNSVKDWLFIHLQMQGPSAFIDNVISYLWSFINQRPPLIQAMHVYQDVFGWLNVTFVKWCKE